MTNPTLKCISPIDGSLYAERETISLQAAATSVEKAQHAQKKWASCPLDQRIALVNAAVAEIGKNNDRLVTELAWQMGRPIRYGGEFGGFSERATYMANIAKDSLKPLVIESSPHFERYIARRALGVVLVIAPWNYPYMTAINTIAPALIAGNCVVLKHATQTLLVGESLAQAFHKVGVPEKVFQNLFLDHQTTTDLIAQNYFDFINFTGSVEGGRSIEIAAAGTFTGVGLELGGKDPGYVMEDANLEAAVETLIDGAMFNAGQCCCGIERIYIHASLFDQFVEKSVSIVKQYRLGNPLDSETTLGPMAQMRLAQVVRQQVDQAIQRGAIAHIPTFDEDDNGVYVSPQILTNVTHKMQVMRDETFGPVVGLMKVNSDAEALALMNDSDFGLTASLWTQDPERAASIGNQIQTGTVFMNRADYLDPALCWTGCKNTGRGGALSVIGYHHLTRPQSYHLRKTLS